MMNSTKLLIRTDASPQLGVRFVKRCLKLAAVWLNSGGSVAFVSGVLPGALSRQMAADGCRLFEIADATGNREDAETLVELVTAFEPDVILLDGPQFGAKYLKQVQPAIAGRAVLATIDDAGIVSLKSGVEPESAVATMKAEMATAILPEFRKSTETPRIYRQAQRMLVDFRDVNPDVWTFPTLKVLSELDRGQLVIDCLLSHHHAELELIDRLKRKTELHLRLHRNADRLSPLAEHADFAIVSASASSLQLAHFGVPGIVVATSADGRLIAQSLGESGAMHNLFSRNISASRLPSSSVGRSANSKDSFSSLLVESLTNLLPNKSRRQTMSDRGQKLIDDQEPRRLMQWLQSHAKGQSSATIPFHNATEVDRSSGSSPKRKSA